MHVGDFVLIGFFSLLEDKGLENFPKWLCKVYTYKNQVATPEWIAASILHHRTKLGKRSKFSYYKIQGFIELLYRR